LGWADATLPPDDDFDSDSGSDLELSESGVLVTPWHCQLSDGVGGIFEPPPNDVLESPADSETTAQPFGSRGTPLIQPTEPPREGSRPHGDLRVAEVVPHLNQRPPTYQLPQKRWKSLEYYIWKVIGFFGFWH